ncbi:FixH family protein [Aquimarina sp. I32.4]|uniref:FixH family protein n=1 Tax=Aquimarina sp. I32.4 TaxID=2053903 RepID=UPI000CDEE7B3|nr:FixH family protein [Aquimarina sp. I32.4]
MKINWGTSIILAFIGFISFILYFVIKMNINQNYQHDLVTEDYYKKELAFQDEINAEENSKTLTNDITIKKKDEGLVISFPKDKNYNDIKGTIFLYRPSNKKLDIKIPISLSNSTFVIKDQELLDGRWNITVDWKYQGISYLFKKSITY